MAEEKKQKKDVSIEDVKKRIAKAATEVLTKDHDWNRSRALEKEIDTVVSSFRVDLRKYVLGFMGFEVDWREIRLRRDGMAERALKSFLEERAASLFVVFKEDVMEVVEEEITKLRPKIRKIVRDTAADFIDRAANRYVREGVELEIRKQVAEIGEAWLREHADRVSPDFAELSGVASPDDGYEEV